MTNIIIVNYQGWQDTLLCVKSILCSRIDDIHITVVDNASPNDSYSQLKLYLEDISRLDEIQFPEWYSPAANMKPATIHLVKAKENHGFSAGNNLGAKHGPLGGFRESDVLWFLNNDTLITRETLTALLRTLDAPGISLVGSKIFDFGAGQNVQTFAGAIDIITGINRTYKTLPPKKKNRLIYPSGVSMALTYSTFRRLGGFDENYFLYYEELDLTAHLLASHHKIAIAENSHVWHKQGASTGSKRNQKKRAFHVEKHKYRSAILFYKKHYPKYVLNLKFIFVAKALRLFILGQRTHSLVIIRELTYSHD